MSGQRARSSGWVARVRRLLADLPADPSVFAAQVDANLSVRDAAGLMASGRAREALDLAEGVMGQPALRASPSRSFRPTRFARGPTELVPDAGREPGPKIHHEAMKNMKAPRVSTSGGRLRRPLWCG